MDSSPFATLPAELRTRIWEAALHSPEPHQIRLNDSDNDSLICTTTTPHSLALAQTCAAFRHESHLLFFALNTFTLSSTYATVRGLLTTFLRAIGPPGANCLRRVIFKRNPLASPRTAGAEVKNFDPKDWNAQYRLENATRADLRSFALLVHPTCKILYDFSWISPFGTTASLDLADLTTTWDDALERMWDLYAPDPRSVDCQPFGAGYENLMGMKAQVAGCGARVGGGGGFALEGAEEGEEVLLRYLRDVRGVGVERPCDIDADAKRRCQRGEEGIEDVMAPFDFDVGIDDDSRIWVTMGGEEGREDVLSEFDLDAIVSDSHGGS